MTVLNIRAARAWLGELLKRRGPVSYRTWQGMLDQGLPVGSIAGSSFVSTDAVQAWLEARAGLPLASAPMPTQANRQGAASPTRRPPGRPRKNP
jgi:hypothetical protein